MGRGRGENDPLSLPAIELVGAMSAEGVDRDLATAIATLAIPSLHLITDPGADSKSFLGGAPLVPEGFQWPVGSDGYPLGFIAQIDLSEITLPDLAGAEGILYLFYDGRGWMNALDGSEKASEIIYLENPGTLQEATVPQEVIDGYTEELGSTSSYHTQLLYDKASLRLKPMLVTPEAEEIERKIGPLGESHDPYVEWLSLRSHGHTLLGYANPVQNPVEGDVVLYVLGLEHEWRAADRDLDRKEMDLFSEQYKIEGVTKAEKNKAIEKIREEFNEARREIKERFLARAVAEGDEWRLLLQIDSAPPFTHWGDLGTLYLMIHKDDLRSRDFSRIVFIKQE